MNFSAAALRLMADKGLTLLDVAEIVAANDVRADPTANERQRLANSSTCGPRERWGYEGPITPRLPDREWWPLRNSILSGDEYTCQYCGSEASCVDHVVPLTRGGSNDPENLVACCQPCNVSKCDRLLAEWKGRITA